MHMNENLQYHNQLKKHFYQESLNSCCSSIIIFGKPPLQCSLQQNGQRGNKYFVSKTKKQMTSFLNFAEVSSIGKSPRAHRTMWVRHARSTKHMLPGAWLWSRHWCASQIFVSILWEAQLPPWQGAIWELQNALEREIQFRVVISAI